MQDQRARDHKAVEAIPLQVAEAAVVAVLEALSMVEPQTRTSDKPATTQPSRAQAPTMVVVAAADAVAQVALAAAEQTEPVARIRVVVAALRTGRTRTGMLAALAL